MADERELLVGPEFEEKLRDYISSIPPEFRVQLEKSIDAMSFEKKCKLIKYIPPPQDNEPTHTPEHDTTQPEQPDEDGIEATSTTNSRRKRRAPPILPREAKTPRATPSYSAASAMLNVREREIQAQRADQQLRDRDAMENEGMGCIQRQRWKDTMTKRMQSAPSAFAFTPTMSVGELIQARSRHTPG